MKIESEVILDWLQAERRQIREDLALARIHWWDGQASMLLGRLEEVDKFLENLVIYGDTSGGAE